MVLKPQSPATYTAISYIYALNGNLLLAVDYLHRSLALRRDDVVTTSLMKTCLEDLMEDDNPPVVFVDVADISSDTCDASTKKPFNPITRCKINFDDDSNNSQSSDVADTSLDMSMDV